MGSLEPHRLAAEPATASETSFPDATPALPASFAVRPGQVYLLRALLQREGASAAANDGGDGHVASLAVTFRDGDGDGGALGPGTGGAVSRLSRGPLEIEIAPAGPLDAPAAAAAEAMRFVLAPPDALRMEIAAPPGGVALRSLSFEPVALEWTASARERMAGDLERTAEMRRRIAGDAFAQVPGWLDACGPLMDLPAAQLAALDAHFAPGGDWMLAEEPEPLLDALEDHGVRLARMRAQADRPLRAAFIGSPRGHEMVSSVAEAFWLREDAWRTQLDALAPEVVVIEAAPASGLSAAGEWVLAFSDLDGGLPPAGAALLDEAARRGLPVHLWFSGDPEDARPWRAAARRADRVLATGAHLDWSAVAPDAFLPPATEPASCSVAHLEARPASTMLVPVASDLFGQPDFVALVRAGAPYAAAFAEFDYGFAPIALSNRIGMPDALLVPDTGRARQRALLQSARMVLLSSQSLRPDSALSRIALDAIASGAIPVLFGRPRTDDPVLAMLDVVHGADDLRRLQGLWRIHWVHERRWRALFRAVAADHVWGPADRAALLGRDPFPEGFDRPRITAVVPTMRPELLGHCLEVFRRQTWEDRELVVVLNVDEVPGTLPELRENEHVYALPRSRPIGECLNRGIARATGRIWVKMDDDDFYAPTYLEETAAYYRAAQADAMGRQAGYYYFDGEDRTRQQRGPLRRCLRMLPPGSTFAGATLSGDRRSCGTRFAFAERNSVDASWVREVLLSGRRVFSGDATAMVVYRHADESRHTWKISGSSTHATGMGSLGSGNMAERFERPAPPEGTEGAGAPPREDAP